MKNDYKVLVFISCLLLLVAVGLLVVDRIVPDNAEDITNQLVDSVREQSFEASAPEVKLHRFDPNEASEQELLQLGVPEWTVRSILKYRTKGGVFSSPEDFARMHGITKGLYRRLLPYIVIGDDYRPAAELVGPRTYPKYQSPSVSDAPRDTIQYPHKLKEGQRININTADTIMLKKVPGIGSYYANKIVALRDKFGGFNSLSQLLSINGFPESSLEYLTIPDGGISKVNINKSSFKRLAQHPYIGYARTKIIFDYRRLKGNISSLQQLSLQKGFSKEEIELIEPYIEY